MTPGAGRLLIAAASGSFGVAALHVAIVLVGPDAYRYFGAGESMARLAEAGSARPAMLTILIAVVFAIFGLYALAGAGRTRPVPLLKPGLVAISLIYVLRGLLVFAEVLQLARAPGSVPMRELLFSGTALAIGLLYAAGTWGRGRTPGGSRSAP